MLRINQWYKNLLIFIPLIFSQRFMDMGLLKATVIGFFALCLASSANYIINDIVDRKKDRANPEKKHRWIASGRIKGWQAIIASLVLLASSLLISSFLSIWFVCAVLLLFGLTQIYSFLLKNELFADILLISSNFVIRAISGLFVSANLPYDDVSPWLILCAFFLSMFLAVAKRESEAKFIKNPENHRPLLLQYTPELTNFLLVVSSVALIVSYSLFSVLGKHKYMAITLPFVIYTVFRYLFLVKSGSLIARHPEKFLSDRKLVFGIVAWGIAAFGVLYISG